MWPEPVTLSSTHATLAPLSQEQASDLSEAAADLQGLWYTMIPTADGMAAEITRRLDLQAQGAMLPFAILDRAGRAVGMTTYMNIDAANRRVEIGSTWLGKSAQRGPVNTECKLMLLRHAFEVLDCIAVEFRTHFMNVQSRRAIERLGAKFDGVLRHHMIMANGSLRDTAVYSIIPGEWPAVRANLEWQLAKPRAV
ncbi:GNAT family protein [uncultured Roseovarius sp.]|uniref:GNAT family N-acetyltransferase n=1 Tax=uncultured Roseovarius sp. TaxID=293344 RepID=UPI0026201193|nr:GNAT family protein [uncultured Roseovarius sp.]